MIVFAHGIVGRADLPIPGLFGAAAAVVLVLSFVGAGGAVAAAAAARGARAARRAVPAWRPTWSSARSGVLVLVVSLRRTGGHRERTANLAPTVVYVALWVGVPPSAARSATSGADQPVARLGRGARLADAAVGGDEPPEPLAYPEWLGRWPAAAGILGFA